MIDENLYEVERDEYAGFIGQLNKQLMDVDQYYYNNSTIIKIHSKMTGNHLCTRAILDDGNEHYYIFNMPIDEERVSPKAVMKITLDTKEEVQAFFDALSKLQSEAHND